VSGIQSAKTVDVVIDGVNEDDPNLGDTVEGVPDLDGDGIDDLVAMSAPDVVVLAPAAAGDYTLWQVTAGRLQDVLDTNTDGQVVGGDFDLDARGDLAISNPADGNDNGVLRIYSGPFAGEVAGSTARGVWEGPDRQMEFGTRITNVGDVEGGGRDTLVVTATSPSGAPADAGALFAVLGSEIP
jgi:hypothetical protein